MSSSVIYKLNLESKNNIFIKREDLIPFSFGGNKARKAKLFFEEIDLLKADCVVTYGSGSSNHCRVVSNMCASKKLKCVIISPRETAHKTFNSQLMELFGAAIISVSVNEVHDTIKKTMKEIKEKGNNPYFIPGGGHGNIGTKAYVECYQEIQRWEKNNHIHFDYIFMASGTGTTQAGLVCGQLMQGDNRKIVGISIARKCPEGREVIIESIRRYLGDEFKDEEIQEKTNFIDDYILMGYGTNSNEIKKTIRDVMIDFGIPMDEIYTGKAFWGMNNYIIKNKIEDKNILFIHTGGTPLFFDYLKKEELL